MDGGAHIRSIIDDFRSVAERARAANFPALGRTGERLSDALNDLSEASAYLLACLEQGRTAEALSGATPYLRLFALAAGGSYLAKGALAGADAAGPAAPLRAATARFFAERLLPECAALRIATIEGGDAVAGFEAGLLAG
jgi:hypothetical protein